MGYTKPQNSAPLASATSYSKNVNPFAVNPKDFASNVGESIHFRILSLEETDCTLTWCKTLELVSKKKGTKFTKNIETSIYKNGGVLAENSLEKHPDPEELKSASFYRVPVFIYGMFDEKGKPLTDNNGKIVCENELKFLEIPYGTWKEITDTDTGLQSNKYVDLTFNPESGLPDYDLILTRKAKMGKDCWELVGDSKNENFHKEVEVALKKHMKAIDAGWNDVQKAMEDFMTQEEVDKLIGLATGAAPQRKAIGGSRPVDNDLAEDNAEDSNAPVADPEPQTRTRRFGNARQC